MSSSSCQVTFAVIHILVILCSSIHAKKNNNSALLCNQIKSGDKQILAIGFVETDASKGLIELMLITTDYIGLIVPEDRLQINLKNITSSAKYSLNLKGAKVFYWDAAKDAATEIQLATGHLHGFLFSGLQSKPQDRTPWGSGVHLVLISLYKSGVPKEAAIVPLDEKGHVTRFLIRDLKTPNGSAFFSVDVSHRRDSWGRACFAYQDVVQQKIFSRAINVREGLIEGLITAHVTSQSGIPLRRLTSNVGFGGPQDRYFLGFNEKSTSVVLYSKKADKLNSMSYENFFICPSAPKTSPPRVNRFLHGSILGIVLFVIIGVGLFLFMRRRKKASTQKREVGKSVIAKSGANNKSTSDSSNRMSKLDQSSAGGSSRSSRRQAVDKLKSKSTSGSLPDIQATSEASSRKSSKAGGSSRGSRSQAATSSKIVAGRSKSSASKRANSKMAADSRHHSHISRVSRLRHSSTTSSKRSSSMRQPSSHSSRHCSHASRKASSSRMSRSHETSRRSSCHSQGSRSQRSTSKRANNSAIDSYHRSRISSKTSSRRVERRSPSTCSRRSRMSSRSYHASRHSSLRNPVSNRQSRSRSRSSRSSRKSPDTTRENFSRKRSQSLRCSSRHSQDSRKRVDNLKSPNCDSTIRAANNSSSIDSPRQIPASHKRSHSPRTSSKKRRPTSRFSSTISSSHHRPVIMSRTSSNMFAPSGRPSSRSTSGLTSSKVHSRISFQVVKSPDPPDT